MTEPLGPNELSSRHCPDFVFEAVNFLIEEKWNGSLSSFNQNEVIDKIINLAPKAIERAEIFNKGWLNFEPAYEKKGWNVKFDKAGYNESYVSYWVFTK